MSLKAFREMIVHSFEQEDIEIINGLHSKLKQRVNELVTVVTSPNDHPVVDEVLNHQWQSCQPNLGLKLSKLAVR